MMTRKFDYAKEVVSWKRKFYDDKKVVLREESVIMRRKLFCGKGSSMTRRKFDYEKEIVLWKSKFFDDKKV